MNKRERERKSKRKGMNFFFSFFVESDHRPTTDQPRKRPTGPKIKLFALKNTVHVLYLTRYAPSKRLEGWALSPILEHLVGESGRRSLSLIACFSATGGKSWDSRSGRWHNNLKLFFCPRHSCLEVPEWESGEASTRATCSDGHASTRSLSLPAYRKSRQTVRVEMMLPPGGL